MPPETLIAWATAPAAVGGLAKTPADAQRFADLWSDSRGADWKQSLGPQLRQWQRHRGTLAQ